MSFSCLLKEKRQREGMMSNELYCYEKILYLMILIVRYKLVGALFFHDRLFIEHEFYIDSLLISS